MIQVDIRENVVVAQVGEITPMGAIVDAKFWNPSTGTYQTTPPTITKGQEAGVVGYGQNTSGYRQNMYMVCRVIAPDGSEGATSSTVQVLDPGAAGAFEFRWACPQVGTYKATLVLYAEIA